MEEKLLELGFIHSGSKESLIGDNYRLVIEKKYKKKRVISISNLGNPNELIVIGELDHKDERKYEDMVVIHNYDFDGYISIERIEALVFALTGNENGN